MSRTRHLEVYPIERMRGTKGRGIERYVEWGWRVVSANGQVMGGSQNEGYKRRADAVKMLLSLFDGTGLDIRVLDRDGSETVRAVTCRKSVLFAPTDPMP